MNTTLELPLPGLSKGCFASINAYSDTALFEQRGIRIAFTERGGGVSCEPYDSLNLGSRVGDDQAKVEENRQILKSAFSAERYPCVVPRQVHGDTIVVLSDSSLKEYEKQQKKAEEGADAVIVGVPQRAALLCFADCVPLIIVSPTGRFAVVHAGWRGVENMITLSALKRLMSSDAEEGHHLDASLYNVYIGPHIQKECFSTGEDVYQRFVETFGTSCAFDSTHIDLTAALRTTLDRAGVASERVAEADACTVCAHERFFSYRAQEGICGRQGAFAIRMG